MKDKPTYKDLEKRIEELEALNASVFHDLKAPLRGIDGYARILTEDYSDRLDEEGNRFLKIINRSTEQMHALIDDLLFYARLESMEIEFEKIDVVSFIKRMVDMRQSELKSDGHRIEFNLTIETIIADNEALTRVMENIFDNAIKFSKKAPIPRIRIAALESGNDWIIRIDDNGIGFHMDYRDRIFRMFQRLERIEEYPGTGVGLAVAKKLTERMSGRIWAEGAPGEGASFFLALPMKHLSRDNN